MKEFNLSFKGHNLKLGKNTCVMGILNITPDSFSDGGVFFKYNDAITRAQQMIKEGADIIDIGGESTRPFAEPVSTKEEIQRVIPVIKELYKTISVPVSIDTAKAEVAKKAIEAGASIVNDITAMEGDPLMASVVSEYEVPVIVMHMKGKPRTMQLKPHYDDPVKEIYDYLAAIIEKAVKNNIPKSKIIIDPGIGFGKTISHNFILHKHLKKFQKLNVPILFGSSRKSFIRKTLSNGSEEEISSALIEIGTQASVSAAILNGAHIVRVHDVASTIATIKIIDSIKNA